MDKLVDKACKGIEFLIALGLAIMVVLVFGNVVLRYGFNSGITVSEEVSRWLFIWGTFSAPWLRCGSMGIWESTWWSGGCPSSARRSASSWAIY